MRAVQVLVSSKRRRERCACGGARHSQVHLVWCDFLQCPPLRCTCALRSAPRVLSCTCRCTHESTGAPLEFKGALCINKGAHRRRTRSRGRHSCKAVYKYFSHSFIWLKRQACADAHAACSCCSDRSKSAHSRSCALLLTGAVAGGASTRRARPYPLTLSADGRHWRWRW